MNKRNRQKQIGSTLIEVLVTIVILSIGLLGLAGLQGQILFSELESYQRAQAVLLMNDMVDRITTNRAAAATYVTASTIGTGDTQPADCSAQAIGVVRDICEWSNELKGAAEVKAGSKIGGMEGARGCITQVTAANPAAGVCQPGVYLVTVVWQGTNKTNAPSVSCGQNLFGDERQRRAISTQVSIGLPSCQ